MAESEQSFPGEATDLLPRGSRTKRRLRPKRRVLLPAHLVQQVVDSLNRRLLFGREAHLRAVGYEKERVSVIERELVRLDDERRIPGALYLCGGCQGLQSVNKSLNHMEYASLPICDRD